MGMETCKQQDLEGPQVVVVEENFITGPPASRSVIDNLRKLLTQRQHSRESDSENKNAVLRSTSGSNSDTAFYSHLSSSTSDSDDSEAMLIFEDIVTPIRKSNSGNNRRRFRRHRSTSSTSSSCSRSPIEKRRKKTVARLKLSFSPLDDPTRIGKLVDNTNMNNSTIITSESSIQILATASSSKNIMEAEASFTSDRNKGSSSKMNDNSSQDNSTSSHKDSSSDGENHRSDPCQPRLTKLKSRRDRNRKRKRSEQTLYANSHHRPKILKTSGRLTEIPVILISPSTDYPDPDSATCEQDLIQNNPPGVVKQLEINLGEQEEKALNNAENRKSPQEFN